MKLQKFRKNGKQKGIAIGCVIALLITIAGVNLYRTFALYKEEKTFNVLRGVVPDFSSGDIKLAITLDGKERDTVPAKVTGKNYKVTVECDNSANGSWNYTKWQVEVSNFKKGTKCNVAFTTTSTAMPSIMNELNFNEVYSSSGNGSTPSLTYTATEDGYYLAIVTQSGSVTSTGKTILSHSNVLAGGAHKFSMYIFYLAAGQTISGKAGWGVNYIIKITPKDN